MSHAHPHVTSVRTLLLVFGALLVLTGITVGAAFFDFGFLNVWVALGIATVKATVVAGWFMHLRHDHGFHSVLLVGSLVFVFLFVGLTLLDSGAQT